MNTKGYTLLEVIITLSMVGILTLSVANYIPRQKYNASLQKTVMLDHQLEQIMTYLINPEIRRAGYLGCRSMYSDIMINSLEKIRPINSLKSNAAQLPKEIKSRMISGSDVLLVSALSLPSSFLVKLAEKNAKSIFVPRNFFTKIGEKIIIADCESADIAIIQAIQRGTKSDEIILESNKGLSKSYLKNTIVSKLEQNYYYVGKTGRKDSKQNTIMALYKQPLIGSQQELIENIDFLQFEFSESKNSTEYKISSKVSDWSKVNKIKLVVQFLNKNHTTEVAIRNAFH